MVGKTELKELLKKIKSSEDIEALKPEIKGRLREISPADLALAEQELLEEGISIDEIRRLCEPHLELLREEIEKEPQTLDAEHPIQILKSEHDVILKKLEELNEIINKANVVKSYDQIKGELIKLSDVAHHLLEAESHHKREEDVLFPELEERGVTGPPMVMRAEHEDLRARKRALKELVDTYSRISYGDFVSKLNESGGYLVQNLNDHIYKENNILYPTALDIVDRGKWSEIKKKFDEIGYCCFTPGHAHEHD
jgi:hypothetical protein